MELRKRYTAFIGERMLASGLLEELLPKLKRRFERDPATSFTIFDDETGRQIDFDLRGSIHEILASARGQPTQAGPGRPRLGVVAREVTLLPRQWDWLEQQPNGASAAIRRLVDEARTKDPAKERRQQATHATGRFLSAMAGNYAGYEEASRRLYRGEGKEFVESISAWPKDVRAYAVRLSQAAFKDHR